MEDWQAALTGVAFLVVVISCLVFANNVHNEKMADKGFCQTMVIGSGSPVWEKCR